MPGAESSLASGQGADQPLDAGAAFGGGIVLVFARGAVADVDGEHGANSLERGGRWYKFATGLAK